MPASPANASLNSAAAECSCTINRPLKLTHRTGQLAGSTTSNAAGSFTFTGLNPANYVVEVVNQAGTIVGSSSAVAVTAGATVTVTVSTTAAAAIAGAGGAAAAAGGGAATAAGVSTAVIVTTVAAAAGVAAAIAVAVTGSPSR